MLLSIARMHSTGRELEKSEDAVREIKTQIEVNAAPERVWAVLTDFEQTPSWNPFIRSMTGPLAEGRRIEVLIQPPGQSAMTFKPMLLTVKPARELRWRGSLVLPGVFDGKHAFLLDEIAPQKTRLAQSETFSGLLAHLIMSDSMLQATRAGFIAMNEALKRRAE
jgi:hypothetical protein